jgi:hypothetical protein
MRNENSRGKCEEVWSVDAIRHAPVLQQAKNAVWVKTGFRAKPNCVIARRPITLDEAAKAGVNPVAFDIIPAVSPVIADYPLVDYDPKLLTGVKYLNLCRTIRRAIMRGDLILDHSKYNANSGRNMHLQDILKYCNLDFDAFVISYLNNMQPCTLIEQPDSNKQSKDLICLYDTGYKINLYLKFKNDGKVIVSFHEDNINGVLKYRRIDTTRIQKAYSAVLLSSTPNSPVGSRTTENVFMSRGLTTLHFAISGVLMSEDVLIVKTADLNRYLDSILVDFLYNACDSAHVLNADYDMLLQSFSNRYTLPNLSFTSVGNYTVSMLTLVIDIFPQVDNSLRPMLLVIVDTLYNEEVTVERRIDIKNVLRSRYLNYSNLALEHLLSLPD